MSDLILLGQAPSMEGCPFDTEVWASLSVLSHKGWEDKPYSKLFCFDEPEGKADENEGLKVAQARGLTIVSNKPWPFVIEKYPLKDIIAKYDTMYFRNDMSYMIALALYKGYKSFSLWGVDQGPEPMYLIGKKYVTYWLGMATGMGVKWELSPESKLWL